MIKFVSEDKFNKVYKLFSIYTKDKFLISLKYKYLKFYVRDLKKVFEMFVFGLFSLIMSPFALIYILLTFIPSLIIKKKVK